jgi:hypothetical protein
MNGFFCMLFESALFGIDTAVLANGMALASAAFHITAIVLGDVDVTVFAVTG